MLIASRRHRPEDLKAWGRMADAARAWSGTIVHQRRVAKARAEFLSFTGAGRCYAGVSWGKDSVCVAHLVATLVPRIPLVWVRVEPDYNPDCLLVRDAFLARYPLTYDEIVVERSAEYVAHGTLDAGMRIATQRHGDRYLSGLRAEESKAREKRVRSGLSTIRTCAPIGHWDGLDVFAYLVTRDLPIHPAYGCLLGGLLDPRRVRVGPLGGARGQRPGDGWGRDEWERRYYRAEVNALERRGPPTG